MEWTNKSKESFVLQFSEANFGDGSNPYGHLLIGWGCLDDPYYFDVGNPGVSNVLVNHADTRHSMEMQSWDQKTSTRLYTTNFLLKPTKFGRCKLKWRDSHPHLGVQEASKVDSIVSGKQEEKITCQQERLLINDQTVFSTACVAASAEVSGSLVSRGVFCVPGPGPLQIEWIRHHKHLGKDAKLNSSTVRKNQFLVLFLTARWWTWHHLKACWPGMMVGMSLPTNHLVCSFHFVFGTNKLDPFFLHVGVPIIRDLFLLRFPPSEGQSSVVNWVKEVDWSKLGFKNIRGRNHNPNKPCFGIMVCTMIRGWPPLLVARERLNSQEECQELKPFWVLGACEKKRFGGCQHQLKSPSLLA